MKIQTRRAFIHHLFHAETKTFQLPSCICIRCQLCTDKNKMKSFGNKFRLKKIKSFEGGWTTVVLRQTQYYCYCSVHSMFYCSFHEQIINVCARSSMIFTFRIRFCCLDFFHYFQFCLTYFSVLCSLVFPYRFPNTHTHSSGWLVTKHAQSI